MRGTLFTFFLLLFSRVIFSSNDDRKLALADFTVIQNGTKTDIKWNLNREPFGTYFTIEKSMDGKTFTKLIDMPVAENGNIYEEYFETDYQPYKGVSYYRIKQTDEEGNTYYSDMISMNYRDDESQSQNTSIPKDDAALLSTINNASEQESLFVLRDSDGNDHYARINLGQEGNYLYALNAQPELPVGIYRIVGTTNNQLYSLKLIIK